jgi:threonine/homoserine/homoserine lactone efflux protein
MIGSILASPTFTAFVGASVILAIIPGPAVVYIVTQTLGQGRTAGLASVGGIALGNFGNAGAACVGLAAVFAASSAAFVVVKLIGAAYLIYLGIMTLQQRSMASAAQSLPTSPSKLFRDGFLVALFNPKTALFIAGLLPQFTTPDASFMGQSLILGCVFVVIALCTDTIYVLTAAVLGSRIRQSVASRPYGRYLSAATFIGLGCYAALSDPRARFAGK